MNFLQIIQLIVGLAPEGIKLTQEIVGIVAEIQQVVSALPTEHQPAVANLAAKALVAKT